MAPNKIGGPPSFAEAPAAGDEDSKIISSDEVKARGCGTDDIEDIAFIFPRDELRVWFTGLMFLTRLPCPGWCDHHPAFLMRSMAYFPIIGILVGVWSSVFYIAFLTLWNQQIAIVASTIASVWLTGCFHEDGLADTFDGFGGGWGRVQILRIMKDSRVGTYALVGMSLVLWLKIQALASLPPNLVPAALIAAHAASRWTSMVLVYTCEYIQDEEDAKGALYNWFARSQELLTLPRLVLGTCSLAATCVLPFPLALLVCGSVVGVTVASGYYGNAVIGGVVGDYLGATIQVAEVACYMALAADWNRMTREKASAWVLLAATCVVPVLYSRRIVDWGRRGAGASS